MLDLNKSRRQLIVHSIIYYRMYESIWTDEMFDKIAMSIVGLVGGVYEDKFTDWDGSTGFHLAHDDELYDKYWSLCDRLIRDYFGKSIPSDLLSIN